MTRVQTIKAPDGSELVVLPRKEYEVLLAAAEDAADVAAYDRAKAALAADSDELVPGEIAERLLDGESPLRVWRTYRGLTQAALGQRAGVPQSVISAIERGRRAPSLATLRALASALGLSLDDLEVIGDTPEPQSGQKSGHR